MAESYHLRTIGYPELRREDGALERIRVRKHLALLVFLAVDRRTTHSRDALVDLLWNQAPATRGRHSLSMALSILRNLLGRTAIIATATTVRLARGTVALDLPRSGTDPVLSTQGDQEYLSNFLEGFEVEDSPSFQHWRDSIRAALLPHFKQSLRSHMEDARRIGDAAALLALSDRMLSLDDLDEAGIRARIEGLALQGERVPALRVYEGWRTALLGALGAEPSIDIKRVASQLRKSSSSHVSATHIRLSTPPDHAPPGFHGRESELRALSECWEMVKSGTPARVAVHGNMGIGKTALTRHFMTTVQLQGAAVASLSCCAAEQPLEFGIAVRFATQLLTCQGAMATAPTALEELRRLGVRTDATPATTCPLTLPPSGPAHIRVASALGALLDAVTDEQPLVFVLDNAVYADDRSIMLLHHLVFDSARPVLLIMTFRPPTTTDSQAVQQTRAHLSRLTQTHIHLGPLSESHSSSLLRSLVPCSRLGPVIRRALIRAGSGNPLALSLLARDWLRHGDNSLALALPAMRLDAELVLADGLEDDIMLDSALATLSAGARKALQYCAVLGHRLNDSALFDLAGLSSRQAIAALSELCDVRVLNEVDGQLVFVTELLRARVYARIPMTIRRRLHQEVVAQLLIAKDGRCSDLEVAWHHIRAGHARVAVEHLLRGSKDGLARGRPDEVIRALGSAVPHLSLPERNRALLILAEAHQEMGDWASSREVIHQIIPTGDFDESIPEIRDVLEIECTRHLQQLPDHEARSILGRLLESATRMTSLGARARAALTAARMADGIKDPTLNAQLAASLSSLGLSPLEPREEAMVRLAKAMSEYYQGAFDRSRAATLELCRFLDATRTTDSTFAVAMTGLGAIACATGKYHEGLSALERAHEVALRLENNLLQEGAAGNLALCNNRLGNYELGRRWASVPQSRGGSPVSGFILAKSVALRGMSSIFLRDLVTAEESLKDLENLTTSPYPTWVNQATFLMRADLLWLLNRRREAKGVAKMAIGMSDVPLAGGMAGVFARWSAITARDHHTKVDCFVALRGLYTEGPTLDAIDRVEVGCSLLMLQQDIGLSDTSLEAAIRLNLSNLPPACGHQLRLLGLRLPNC